MDRIVALEGSAASWVAFIGFIVLGCIEHGLVYDCHLSERATLELVLRGRRLLLAGKAVPRRTR